MIQFREFFEVNCLKFNSLAFSAKVATRSRWNSPNRTSGVAKFKSDFFVCWPKQTKTIKIKFRRGASSLGRLHTRNSLFLTSPSQRLATIYHSVFRLFPPYETIEESVPRVVCGDHSDTLGALRVFRQNSLATLRNRLVESKHWLLVPHAVPKPTALSTTEPDGRWTMVCSP